MDNDKLTEEWQERASFTLKMMGYVIIILTMLVSVLFLSQLTQCGGPKETIVETPPGPPPLENKCLDGLPVGARKQAECPLGQEGEIVFLCKEANQPSVVESNTCRDTGEPPPPPPPPEECNLTTFDRDILPIVNQNCVSCHAGFDRYDAAVIGIDAWIDRIYKSAEDPKRMPRKPNPELSVLEKTLLKKWREDGLIKDDGCQKQPGLGLLDYRYIEQEVSKDLDKVRKLDQPFIRYLSAAHIYNYRGEAGVIRAKASVDKTLNSLVSTKKDMVLSTYVDEKKTIFRFDLRSFELSRNDWFNIEKRDPLDIVSQTDIGKSIQLRTATRKPILHHTNFIDIALSNADLYYSFLEIRDFNSLIDDNAVNYADDLRRGNAVMVGNNDSPLTRQKPRLLSRHESRYGFFWTSYDVFPNGDNLVKNPLLKETGSHRVFRFDANEYIWTLPNGLLGFALTNNKGVLQKEAPIDIVYNYESTTPPSPIIANAISCFLCHKSGMIPMTDEIRNAVNKNRSEYDIDDIERVQTLYRTQNSLNQYYRGDNKIYHEALRKLGIDPTLPDPINEARDELYYNYNDAKLAAFLTISLSDFRECLESSDAKADLGAVLSGGVVTYEQIQQNMKTLARDCRIFQDPITE